MILGWKLEESIALEIPGLKYTPRSAFKNKFTTTFL
jgi:hypothetical protein